ncbi:hypothetical protein HMN09_00256600 [Mycena chlorophos]|uniref:Uncharacterized protein n=1 Tax=Mycena chlorophos TaxID=658473 RepID=A0A8H6WHU5_MYCCL|nr:hypothetical protein HMN09_00256600 [Mycena chlorophos]
MMAVCSDDEATPQSSDVPAAHPAFLSPTTSTDLYSSTMFSRALVRTSAPIRRLASTASAAKPASSASHTADSYSKDVDSSPAPDSKVHRVDPNSQTVQRPHDPPSNAYSQTGVEAGVKHAQGKPEGKKQ